MMESGIRPLLASDRMPGELRRKDGPAVHPPEEIVGGRNR